MDTKLFYNRCKKENFIIAGPCVLESFELALDVAKLVADISSKLGILAVFKSSFDKANRTSASSFRGPGLETGLKWLAEIKKATGLPIVTDIHEKEQAPIVAEVADILQIPAFLCRQTSLLEAAGGTGKIVNIKKGQFVSPYDMRFAIKKVHDAGGLAMLTERGTFFGYNNLVVDFRSLVIMQEFDVPVIFDATHSVQLPGGSGEQSGGERQFVPVLARAAAASGVNGIFMECHPCPDKALCDGPNSWPTENLHSLVENILAHWKVPHAC